MPHVDVMVLGAGIVGTSAALQLAKRGLTVALVDRRGPGEETSYGNGGVIVEHTVFPFPIPRRKALMRIALRRAGAASYHFSHLPTLLPWLRTYKAFSTPEKMLAFADNMRPLFSRSRGEHEVLMAEAGAGDLVSTNGYIKGYRNISTFEALQRDLDATAAAGLEFKILDTAQTVALEPDMAPLFQRAVFWPHTMTILNPLRLTRAYVQRFTDIGGKFFTADASRLRRADGRWHLNGAGEPLSADAAVLTLGPWTPDVLAPLGVKLPLMVKRGYSRHYHLRDGKRLSRPILDVDRGYSGTPMEQGIRIATGVEFAARDAPPTPVQLRFVEPSARDLLPIDRAIEPQPWFGSRPCFPDQMPVIGRVPGQADLWVDVGHAHWGLTLGPVSGRLLADMMTDAAPFTDPKPYAPTRFM